MASSDDEVDVVVLELLDPSVAGEEELRKAEKISISTSDLERWTPESILGSPAIQVQASRTRLIEESSYFHGLLGGSFSESHLKLVPIRWNPEVIIQVLQFMHKIPFNVTSNNYLLLLEAALYFGVGRLLAECETWFNHLTSARNEHLQLNTLIDIWNFSLEHGVAFVSEQCQAYLAHNFAWAASQNSFTDTPFDLLSSCIKHPKLTLDSEKQLCEALLLWLSKNTTSSQCTQNNQNYDILNKVRVSLLPLEFAAGVKRQFSQFADGIISTIMNVLQDCSSILFSAMEDDKLDNYKIRLTEYSEKIVLSGCTHITVALLFLSVLPLDMGATSMKKMINSLSKLDNSNADRLQISWGTMRAFEAVHLVDFSRCQNLQFVATVMWLLLAFPSLSIFIASQCLQITMEDIHYLIRKISSITEVDVAVDTSPLILSKASILSSSTVRHKPSNGLSYKMISEESLSPGFTKTTFENSIASNLSKLTLEGRNDVDDQDLWKISAVCGSLSYLNIKGCSMVTDEGIAKLISKCFLIHSLILSYTSFGRISVLAVCSDCTLLGNVVKVHDHKFSNTIAFGLQQLNVDGCIGIDQNSLSQLMSHTYMLKILSIKESLLDDNAFGEFSGSLIESLDISETLVSLQTMIPVIRRNPGIRCLKATGCKNLHQYNSSYLAPIGAGNFKDLLETTNGHLEEMAVGWGLSYLSPEVLKALSRLKNITISLGASPGHDILYALPKICRLLEYVILKFQVISDEIVRSTLESLKSLQLLELHCCLGDLTSSSFHVGMPTLRVLRLHWVTSWMTNNDLSILTQNCPNIIELSLSGCKLLNSDSQEIISGGWPGLTYVHLEECGTITSGGVSFLFDCKAIEDLLLRHNGKGIRRNIIFEATSKLPQLRKVGLDLCDACEGGFDSPSPADRCFLRFVKISRCKSLKCGFDLQKPVHKDTILIEWNSTNVTTTMVEERV